MILQAINSEGEPLSEHLSMRGGCLVWDGFEEADPLVIEVIGGAENPEVAAHACLQVGARASKAAMASLDSLIVEQAFGELKEGFGSTVSAAVDRIVGTTEAFVDEERGALPLMLRRVKEELTGELDALFDADSKSSALARMTAVFEAASAEHTKAARRALDPEDPESPLGRWKAQVVSTIQESVGLVLKQLTELTADAAAAKATEKTFALTTAKGFSFEDEVHRILGNLATRHGDLAEHVGKVSGSTGALTGDEVVTLNLEDTGGRRAAVVFEAKRRKRKLSMREAMDELDAAMANREAVVAVAVFATPDNAPASVPFTPYGNKAIVVIDPEIPEDRVLELAYMWARWEARKALTVDAEAIDHAAVEMAFGTVQRALNRATTVRRCHSTVLNNIGQAKREVDELVAEIADALAALRVALGD
ncbi:MAG TPA: hypothetical protein VNG12_17035 [Acidimicrobiales bacterium]|nr:hypothetical protein [Acidimicrobiales bacterium]